ncbi:MAG: hypothetical protein EU532_08025 [Promethearchaeota archaeon]|nr:MAG: hypothetical protein EU532_08025 [Candidatus Lokiarchaeota archaeon]
MSLEKWIKPQKDKDESNKESKDKKKEIQSKKPQSKISNNEKDLKVNKVPATKFSKYLLICPKKSCGYQKTLMKRELNDRDKTCPRCKGTMKIVPG